MRRENRAQTIQQGNVVLTKQEALIATDMVGIAMQKTNANQDITYRHDVLKEAIAANSIDKEATDKIYQQNENMLSDIINKLNS